MQRSSGYLPWLALGGLASAAAGVGFAGYVYFAPYQRVLTQLKRQGADLTAARTALEAKTKEVERLKEDLTEVRGARNQRLSVEGRTRVELKLIKGQIEEKLAPAGVKVTMEARRMVIRFPEDAVFQGRGALLGEPGLKAVQLVAQAVGDKAGRVLVAAPMGGTAVARWVRGDFPTAADLSAARSGNVLRELVKAGLRAPSTIAVIGSTTGPEAANEHATLDIEVDAKE